jgi:hypothetical protein
MFIATPNDSYAVTTSFSRGASISPQAFPACIIKVEQLLG